MVANDGEWPCGAPRRAPDGRLQMPAVAAGGPFNHRSYLDGVDPQRRFRRGPSARDLQPSRQMADELAPELRTCRTSQRALFSHLGLSHDVMARRRQLTHARSRPRALPMRRGRSLISAAPNFHARCTETKRRWCWARPTACSRSWRSILTEAHKLAKVPTRADGDHRRKRAPQRLNCDFSAPLSPKPASVLAAF